jgi:DNA-binding FadR family transcriptional regulator
VKDEGAGAGLPGLTGRVAAELGAAILRGEFAPGATIPVEEEAARRLGVGRNALREAVRLLVGKGLVAPRRRVGTVVCARARWNALDPELLRWMFEDPALRPGLIGAVNELRAMIEPETAALAARRAGPAGAARLRAAYAGMVRDAHDPDAAIEADIAFHRVLMELAGNDLLLALLPAFEVALRGNFRISIREPGGFIRSLDLHGRIVEAVAAGDGAAARAAMATILAANEERLRLIIAEEGGLP